MVRTDLQIGTYQLRNRYVPVGLSVLKGWRSLLHDLSNFLFFILPSFLFNCVFRVCDWRGKCFHQFLQNLLSINNTFNFHWVNNLPYLASLTIIIKKSLLNRQKQPPSSLFLLRDSLFPLKSYCSIIISSYLCRQ